MAYTPATIGAWYIFDTGPLREAFGLRYKGEDCNLEKLLYFYPDDCPDDQKKDRVGCCEALVNFTKMFSPDQPCQAVHLQRQRHGYIECEPGVWCVLEVNNPVHDADGQTDYQEEELEDLWVRSLLQQSWDYFQLFHGSLRQCWARGGGENAVREALAAFMPRCLQMMMSAISDYNVLNSLDGIQYLPVDKQAFLSIQYVVNIIQSSFEQVQKCAFLYNGQLVWSGFDQQVIRSLYHMSASADQTQGANAAALLRMWAGTSEHPEIYDQDGNRLVLLLCCVDQVLALFQLPHEAATEQTVRALEEYVSSEVGSLAKIMAKSVAPSGGADEPWKYIYFNKMNLALKSSLKLRASAVAPTVMRTLNEMLAHLESNRLDNAEICVRQQKDGWIVGRKSNDRLLFAILESKSSTLSEIAEDLDQFMEKCFNNILM